MPKVEVSREKIVEILESKSPKSLTEVYRHLGGVGKLSGSVAGKMRTLVPDIEKVVAGNRAGEGAKGEGAAKKGEPKGRGETTLRTSGKSKKTAKRASKATYPHCDMNPFREGSNYSLAFDILAASKDGLPLADWRERYAKAARKPLKLAVYDIQVLLTAKESPTGERHRSCRDGFYIEREGDHVTLKF